jgi:hypothetical protein
MDNIFRKNNVQRSPSEIDILVDRALEISALHTGLQRTKRIKKIMSVFFSFWNYLLKQCYGTKYTESYSLYLLFFLEVQEYSQQVFVDHIQQKQNAILKNFSATDF